MRVCEKCQSLILQGDSDCPVCDSGGASDSAKYTNTGIYVPRGVENENREVEGKVNPHEKWSRVVSELRNLILDDSRGMASKQKYSRYGGKQGKFESLIQKLGNFKASIDFRFFEQILCDIAMGKSLRSKIHRYLRECEQVEKRDNSECYYNTEIVILSSQVEKSDGYKPSGEVEIEGNPFGCVYPDRQLRWLRNGGMITPAPSERSGREVRAEGNIVPQDLEDELIENEEVEVKVERWTGYRTSDSHEGMFPDYSESRPAPLHHLRE